MAVLSNIVRQELRADYGSRISERRDVFTLSRPELDAAIAAIDAWIETNAAVFNAALPVAARNNLTAAQKAELFYIVAQRRYGN